MKTKKVSKTNAGEAMDCKSQGWGLIHKLMKELEQDPEHYKNYIRMNFEELATKLEPDY